MRTALPAVFTLIACVGPLTAGEPLKLSARVRAETAPGSGRYHAVARPLEWDAAGTAIVICDMWDKHWCPGATARVDELAPRVDAVAAAVRAKGGLVIHCPSDTMDFYKETPQRRLAQHAPKATPKVPLARWCKLDPAREGQLPIDDTDGGCAEAIKSHKAWTRQHPAIRILDGDAITDSDEAYHLMRSRGIRNVLVTGVHTNMCVLGRPFSIRQLVAQGLNVALVRDLTDTMYNPAKAPFVSHFTGTDLVVEHIEKHWCPTVLSSDLVGGREFRFQEDARPHLAIVAAEDEYQTERTLPAFALKHLGRQFRVSVVYADAKDRHRLPGIDVLASADVLLLSVRRKPLHPADLDAVRKYVAGGKPVVALRTSSHAFAPRKGEKLPAGIATWEGFDQEVLGCSYTGHHSNKLTTHAAPADAAARRHPVLAGVDGFESPSWLYKSSPLAADCVVLLTGKTGDFPAEPAAWVREPTAGRGRVFYTCLGHAGDFEKPEFVALLANGVKWAAGK